MHKRRFRGMHLALTALALFLGGASQARADTIALQSLTGGSNFGSFNGSNQTIGWSFTPTVDIDVTQLGAYDSTPPNPLSQTHEVGLWSSDGTLLASTTVQTTSPLTDSFRYEPISTVLLTAGQTYLIGEAITSPFSDVYNIPTSTTLAPEITLLGSARNGTSGGFSDPTTVTAGEGRFGPNFQFELPAPPPPPAPVSTPEPSSLALLTLGGAALAGWRRWKKSRVTA